MNKQDLKSLLENIYHLLAEEDGVPPQLIAPDSRPASPGLYFPGYGFVPVETDDDNVDQDEGDFTLTFPEMTPEQLQAWLEQMRQQYLESLRRQEEERQRLQDMLRNRSPRPRAIPPDGGTLG